MIKGIEEAHDVPELPRSLRGVEEVEVSFAGSRALVSAAGCLSSDTAALPLGTGDVLSAGLTAPVSGMPVFTAGGGVTVAGACVLVPGCALAADAV